MNFLMRKTFRRFNRFPIVASDFMNSMLKNIFPQINVEYQLVGPYQPNYGENNNESPNSIFDEVILRMAAPKSKVNFHSQSKSSFVYYLGIFYNSDLSNFLLGIPI
jgi:hypothetical protein